MHVLCKSKFAYSETDLPTNTFNIYTRERERERERAKARRPYAESKIIFSLRTGFFATSTGKPLLGVLRSDLQSVRLPKSLVSFGDCWIQIFASNNLTHTVR